MAAIFVCPEGGGEGDPSSSQPPPHRASSLPQSPINLLVKQILGLTSGPPRPRSIRSSGREEIDRDDLFNRVAEEEEVEEGRRRRKRAGYGVKNGGGRIGGRGEGEEEPHFIAENSRGIGRGREPRRSRYNWTGGPCSRGTRISVFWCVDPFRHFPSKREGNSLLKRWRRIVFIATIDLLFLRFFYLFYFFFLYLIFVGS